MELDKFPYDIIEKYFTDETDWETVSEKAAGPETEEMLNFLFD